MGIFVVAYTHVVKVLSGKFQKKLAFTNTQNASCNYSFFPNVVYVIYYRITKFTSLA